MTGPASTARWLLPLLLAISLAALQGCAALGLEAGAAGIAAVQGGAGAIVKAGTEYKSNGIVNRTFSQPREAIHDAVVETLNRLEIDIHEDKESEKRTTIVGKARGRKVQIRLEPLTPVMTRMQVTVKKGLLSKDGATASELLAQMEDTLDEAIGSESDAARR